MSANRYFWFPSQSGSYANYAEWRFCIYYPDESLESPINTDVNADIIEADTLDFPFEINSEDQTVRLSTFGFTINNAYDILTTYAIIDENYRNKTFLKIYRNGSYFWNGLLYIDEIYYSDYYISGGILKYKKVKLTFQDALRYYTLNNITLDDIGYVDGIKIRDLLNYIAQGIGCANANISSFYTITDIGGEQFNMNNPYQELRITNQTKTDNVLKWLNKFCQALGAYYFCYANYLYIVPRGDYNPAGSALDIANNNIIKYSLIKDENITYIKYLVHYTNSGGYLFAGVVEYKKEAGIKGVKNDYEVDATEIISNIYYPTSNDNIYGTISGRYGHNYDYNVADDSKYWPASGVRCGDLVGWENSDSIMRYSYIEKICGGSGPTQNDIQVYGFGTVIEAGASYTIIPGVYKAYDPPTTENKRFKAYLLYELIKNIYPTIFQYSKDLIQIEISLNLITNLHYLVSYGGRYHRIIGASLDIVTNRAVLNLKPVAAV
jgi:hypothetical protein